MSNLEKTNQRLKAQVATLQKMIEDKTREVFLSNQEIVKSSMFTKNIIESIPDMLVVMDTEGKIIQTNKITLEKLNLRKEDILKKNIRELISPEDVEKIKKIDFTTGQENFETRVTSQTGYRIWVMVSRSIIKSTDSTKKDHIVYVLKDIEKFKDDEKKIEDQRLTLVNSSKMAALGEMASGMAHEVKNPLGIIDGQLRRLVYEIEQEENQDKTETFNLINGIQDNVKRIQKIINSFRVFSRKADNDPFDSISLKEIINEMDLLSHEKFKNQKIDVRIDPIPEEIMVSCRESEILQIFLNLLTNAHDAITKNEEKWIQVKTTVDKSFAYIHFIDSGKGIDKKTEEKIFFPFFTTKGVGKGTGLGLSISKGIMETHKGDLYYELREEHTCFTVKLPLDKVSQAS